MRPPPSSIRFPPGLRERLRERAEADRRTFSNEVLLLVERGLTAAEAEEEEVERLADVYHETIGGERQGQGQR